MEFEVLVRLKDEVLDPEGRAIKETFERQGITGVSRELHRHVNGTVYKKSLHTRLQTNLHKDCTNS